MLEFVWIWVGCAVGAFALRLLISWNFLLHVGLAAIIMGGISSFWTLSWSVHSLIFFALLSFLRVLAGKLQSYESGGKVFVLPQSLEGGCVQMSVGSRIRFIEGPNLPKGTTVVVRSSDGEILRVEKRQEGIFLSLFKLTIEELWKDAKTRSVLKIFLITTLCLAIVVSLCFLFKQTLFSAQTLELLGSIKTQIMPFTPYIMWSLLVLFVLLLIYFGGFEVILLMLADLL